jgi:hypothetical protein
MDGFKYCTSCQSMRREESGKWTGAKIKRWVCVGCANRSTVSQYLSNENKKKLTSSSPHTEPTNQETTKGIECNT